MLPLLMLIFLEITCFHSQVAALSITMQNATIVGQPSLVIWAREASDGEDQLAFDLRFLNPGPPSKDVGLALANIVAPPSIPSGIVKVVFPSAGPYEIAAVTGADFVSLGKSGPVNAFQVSNSTSNSTSTSTSTSTPSSTSQSIHSASTSAAGLTTDPLLGTTAPSSGTLNLGAIIVGSLGGVAFLGILASLVISAHRRRRLAIDKRWSFHRHTRPPILLDTPFISPTVSVSSPEDMTERGLPRKETPSARIVMTTFPSDPPPSEPPSGPLPDLPPGSKPPQGRVMQVPGNDPGPMKHVTFR